MQERGARVARILSVLAGATVALACGTNYAYSAWGPDFAKHMHLSTTEQNVIGAAGNVGMYAMGIPAGLIIDNYNPRWGILIGAVSLATGYFSIHSALERGPGSMSVSLISFFSFLTGTGSCCAFSAAVKVAASNWPSHRGTATAFPLAGFGLSAFFFATVGHLFLGNDTKKLLLLLSIATVCFLVISFPFIRLLPTTYEYMEVVDDEDRPSSRSNGVSRGRRSSKPLEQGTLPEPGQLQDDDQAPLLDAGPDGQRKMSADVQTEITGLHLLPRIEFWQLFSLLCLLAGVGLMSINNIGNDAAALWHAFDPKASHEFVQGREKMHVAILSMFSFFGRICSGIGSDYLVKRLHASRFWCLVVSSVIFTVAQLFALTVTNPNFLFLVSSLTGLAYGALFGVFPAITADVFGVTGLALNWGFMTLAPVISANIYNICYGRIYDAKTTNARSGECEKGLQCYKDAYWVTLASSLAALVLSLYCIRYQKRKLDMARQNVRDA